MKKSLYVGYSEKQVAKMENYYYVLQFGGDFVSEDSSYLFTKAEVARLYNNILGDLVGILADGNAKDRKYSLDLIGGLVIQPMRLH